jgi:hypothetical protein
MDKLVIANLILGRLRSRSSSTFLLSDADNNHYVLKNPCSGNNNFQILSDSFLSNIAKNFQIIVPEKAIVKFSDQPVIDTSLNNEDRDSFWQFVEYELLASRYLNVNQKFDPADIDHILKITK